MSKDMVKMLLEFQYRNYKNMGLSTEAYIAALITTANILSEELKP